MAAIDTTTYRSPNHDQRPAGISAIVLHHGAGTRASDLATLTSPTSGVSAHYYVCRDGTIYQLVDDARRAWHAGASALAGVPDVNDYSLGVETEHQTLPSLPQHTDWPPAQLEALAWLCRTKAAAYQIPPSRVVSHRAIALPAGRKADPAHAPLAPEPRFRIWVAEVFSSTPPPAPLPPHGFVLTSAQDANRLAYSLTIGRYPLLLCVTGWGLAWTPESREQVAAMTERLVIRTVAGDPSAGQPYPNWERVLNEVAPWMPLRPTLDIVIGNEPNARDDVDPAGYAWHLDRAITELRTRYPAARITSPALIANDTARRWAASPEWRRAIGRCDHYGAHVYAHHRLGKGDAAYDAQTAINAQTIPTDKPWAYSEYGIHDPNTPDAEKARRYKRWLSTLQGCAWAAAYHLCHNPIDADQAAYAIDATGLAAYGGA